MARSVIRTLPAPGAENGNLVRAAGGILLRPAGRGRFEIATVHRKRRDDWSLPKGKLEAGETFEACALREVLEETGYDCVLGSFAGQTEYLDRRRRPKVVAYWYLDPAPDTDFYAPPAIGTDEVDEVRWLELTVARRALTQPHDQELLGTVGLRRRLASPEARWLRSLRSFG